MYAVCCLVGIWIFCTRQLNETPPPGNNPLFRPQILYWIPRHERNLFRVWSGWCNLLAMTTSRPSPHINALDTSST
ncbi:hypothetical protein BJX61DRAFT_512430 [Aspergillus egyptiacus]|nr:hypothetical protein BJX61DRAFT_512430 [Aspergillus egyptiacus]